MIKTVLIAGASGRAGSHAAHAFKRAGWEVRSYQRGSDMAQAAQGCSVIFNGLNPPNYQNWEADLPQITRDMIAAAKASGARVILPGNVYNFGTQPAPWSHKTPHRPNTGKGRIRADIEAMYRESRIKILILRAGDFIDAGQTGNWFDKVLTGKLDKRVFTYPGNIGIPHAWAYLPDFARAAVELVSTETLSDFEDVAFPGFTLSGAQMREVLEQIRGQKLKSKPLFWPALRMAGLVWKTGAALVEMRYLWDHPHALDGAKFARLLPDFTPTPVADALRHATSRDQSKRACDRS